MIYAARSDQYRAAYLTYLKKKFPLLFGLDRASKPNNTIFIINHGINHRSTSNPEVSGQSVARKTEVDVKVEYSMDLQCENIIHSYTGSIKVRGQL